MTFLLPRMILGIIVHVIVLSICGLAMCCKRKEAHLTGCSKCVVRSAHTVGIALIAGIFFLQHLKYEYLSEEQVNYYEEFLGSRQSQLDYQKEE